MKADPALVIPDPSKSILEGAIQVSGWNSVRTDSIFRMYFDALAQKYHFSLTEPSSPAAPRPPRTSSSMAPKGKKLKMTYNRGTGTGVLEQPFEGIIPNLERRFRETPSDAMRKELEECMSTSPCPLPPWGPTVGHGSGGDSGGAGTGGVLPSHSE